MARRKKNKHTDDFGQSIFDEYDLTISKTEQKKAMQRLQDVAVTLAAMSTKRIKQLPASETFIDGLLELNQTTAREAKRRQLQRVGKLFREELPSDTLATIQTAYEHYFSPEQRGKLDTWHQRFIDQGDEPIKVFCKAYKTAEPNTINQFLIHYEHGKTTGDDDMVTVAVKNLESYVQQVALIDK